MLRKAMVAAGLMAGAVLLTGAAHMGPMMIDTKNATLKGESIVFPMVKAAKDGYLVVHAVKDGKPVVPGSIGHTTIKAGENVDVAVKIEGGAHSGTEYVAMLHDETNGNGTYEFGAGSTTVDTPSMADGKPYALMFTLAK